MKAVIFDLDGTLLDTLEDITQGVNFALRTYGLEERTLDEVRSFVGNGAQVLIASAMAGEPVKEKNDLSIQLQEIYDEGLKTYRDYYALHSMDLTQPYAGIEKMLETLKIRGIPMAIVSNKPDADVQILHQHFFAQWMDVAVGRMDEIAGKPAPDTVLLAAQRLGLPIEDCIYVGDSEVDIETAKNCGIPCISVTWGFRDQNELKKHGAKTFVKNPEELLAKLLYLCGFTQTYFSRARQILRAIIRVEALVVVLTVALFLAVLLIGKKISEYRLLALPGLLCLIFLIKNVTVLLVLGAKERKGNKS